MKLLIGIFERMSTKCRALQLNKGILCPLSELVNASIDGTLDSFDNLPRGGIK